ncbi:hypothetical protein V8F20_008267 [Naviculisporaceae sp. PSN 640]
MAKTSAVFLGSVAVATVCAHKFWPKGFIYGEKEDWEKEKSFERKKKAVKEELDKVEGRVLAGVGRSRSQSQSTTCKSTSTRELVYRDRDYDRDRVGYNGDTRPLITSSGREGGKDTMVRSEQEALVYRQDRGANGRKTAVVIQREEELRDNIIYHNRDDRNRSRSQNAPRLSVPAENERDIIYTRTTTADHGKGAGIDYDDYLDTPARSGHGQGGHIRSRSAHTNINTVPARSPSPTTTTRAVAGSPVTATDIRRQRLQVQQQKRNQSPRDEYYLLPAPPASSQRPLQMTRSNSFSAPTSTTRHGDRENDRYDATNTKYYYQNEEALLQMASRRGRGQERVADRDRDRQREIETVYVYRDRDRSRDREKRDVRVVDTYYDYNYR